MPKFLGMTSGGLEQWDNDRGGVVELPPGSFAGPQEWTPPTSSPVPLARQAAAMNLSNRQSSLPVEPELPVNLSAQNIGGGILSGIRGLTSPPPLSADLSQGMPEMPPELPPRKPAPTVRSTGILSKTGQAQLPTVPSAITPVLNAPKPGAEAAVQSLTDERLALVDESEAAKLNHVARRQAILDDEQLQQNAIEKRRVDAENARNTEIDKYRNEFSSAQDALAQAEGTEVSPANYWSSKNVAGKIFAGIAALAAGYRGDPEFINREIARDVALQQANAQARIGKTKAKLQGVKGMYDLMLQRYGDPNIAAQAATAALQANVERSLTRSENMALNPEIKANAANAKQKIKDDRIATELNIANARLDNQLKRAQLAAPPKQEGALTPKDIAKQTEEYGKRVSALNDANAPLKTLKDAIKEDDIKATGFFGQYRPSLGNEEVIKIKQAAGQMIQALAYAKFGSTVKPDELEKLIESQGLSRSRENEFRVGVNNLVNQYERAFGELNDSLPQGAAQFRANQIMRDFKKTK